ncbi:MAG: hypothetical protein JST32_09135 [Bacteroidetes bacterium]|nr:hypothetical protein [Bacteroidota bacterium]
MKKEEKYEAKQYRCFYLGLMVTLNHLIIDSFSRSSIVKNATKKLAAATTKAALLRISRDEKIKKEESNKYTIEKCKEDLVEALSVPKDTRNEKLLTELVTCIKSCRTDIETLQGEIIDLRHQASLAESDESELKWALKELENPEKMMQKYFKCGNRNFSRGSFSPFCITAFKVWKEPRDQEYRGLNIQYLFPDWSLNRFVYYVVLLQLMRDDDFSNYQRDYGIGIAKALFDEVFKGNEEMWFKFDNQERKSFFHNCFSQLETWLMKPLPLDELLMDPLFKTYIELKGDYPKKTNAFKGGTSHVGQLLEFISFSKEYLAQKEPVLEA